VDIYCPGSTEVVVTIYTMSHLTAEKMIMTKII
jgi:hypothetical protein